MIAASNVKIRSVDMPIIDRVFGMGGGRPQTDVGDNLKFS